MWLVKVQPVGVWPGVMLPMMHCKRLWTMHVGLVLIVFLFSLRDSVFSLTPFRPTLLMPSTATISAEPELLAPAILLELPPLPPVIPVSLLSFPHFHSFSLLTHSVWVGVPHRLVTGKKLKVGVTGVGRSFRDSLIFFPFIAEFCMDI